jgi:hypothetical protein
MLNKNKKKVVCSVTSIVVLLYWPRVVMAALEVNRVLFIAATVVPMACGCWQRNALRTRGGHCILDCYDL